MGITQTKIGVMVAGFVLIFVSGYWLRHNRQHKLSTDLGRSHYDFNKLHEILKSSSETIEKLGTAEKLGTGLGTVLAIMHKSEFFS